MTHSNDSSHVKHPAKTARWWQLAGLNPIARITIALLGMLLTLGMINMTIAKFEAHLATGNTVLLELAPVDPRGFFQGDYMALRFAMAANIQEALRDNKGDTQHAYDGIAVIKKNHNGVGQFVRLTHGNIIKAEDLEINEMLLHFRIRNNQVKFATNAFFFQEGHADAYEAAEYGLFRVNEAGQPLLTHMVDSEFNVIKVNNRENQIEVGIP